MINQQTLISSGLTMIKPIHITGLTQEQRNTCVAASIKSDSKNLNDWAVKVLLRAAEQQLHIQPFHGEWDDYREANNDKGN